MLQLIMNNHRIQSIRDLYNHFSPADMLRQRESFAETAAALLLPMNRNADIGHLNIFALTLLRQQGNIPENLTLFAHERMPAIFRQFLSRNLENFSRLNMIEESPTQLHAKKSYETWARAFAPEGGITVNPQLVNPLYEIASNTHLPAMQQTELYLLLVSGYRLAGKTKIEDTPITSAEAKAAFLRKNETDAEEWISLPGDPAQPIMLHTRPEPYKFLLHPARSGPIATIPCTDAPPIRARLLPKGCQLHTHRVEAQPNPFGNSELQVTIEFYLNKNDPQPALRRQIRANEHLYLNAVHSDNPAEAPLAVNLLPRSVQRGALRLEAVPNESDALLLYANGAPEASFRHTGRITSFTPGNDSKSAAYLLDGKLLIPGCSMQIDRAFRRLHKTSDLVEVVYINDLLFLLRKNGMVYGQHSNGDACAENVLSLLDATES